MPNRNYIKGRRKEYKLCKELRELGYEIVQRTAGSHSPIDLFAIDRLNRKILFIQAKPNNYSESKTKKIEKDLYFLNDLYEVEFEVR